MPNDNTRPRRHRISLLRAQEYTGIYTRVAKQLRVSPSVVRRVGVGKGKSKRIELALIEELRRIERYIEQKASSAA